MALAAAVNSSAMIRTPFDAGYRQSSTDGRTTPAQEQPAVIRVSAIRAGPGYRKRTCEVGNPVRFSHNPVTESARRGTLVFVARIMIAPNRDARGRPRLQVAVGCGGNLSRAKNQAASPDAIGPIIGSGPVDDRACRPFWACIDLFGIAGMASARSGPGQGVPCRPAGSEPPAGRLGGLPDGFPSPARWAGPPLERVAAPVP